MRAFPDDAALRRGLVVLGSVLAAGCVTSEPTASLRCGETMRQCMATPGATQETCNETVDACNANVSASRAKARARQDGFDEFKREKAKRAPAVQGPRAVSSGAAVGPQ